jgi:hypothetical protein
LAKNIFLSVPRRSNTVHISILRRAASGLIVLLLAAIGAGPCDSLMGPGLSAGEGSLLISLGGEDDGYPDGNARYRLCAEGRNPQV